MCLLRLLFSASPPHETQKRQLSCRWSRLVRRPSSFSSSSSSHHPLPFSVFLFMLLLFDLLVFFPGFPLGLRLSFVSWFLLLLLILLRAVLSSEDPSFLPLPGSRYNLPHKYRRWWWQIEEEIEIRRRRSERVPGKEGTEGRAYKLLHRIVVSLRLATTRPWNRWNGV